MSWIDRIVEQQIAAAIHRGELDVPAHLVGKPLDLDTPRGDGWWAEQFVRNERSRLLHDESLSERAQLSATFWRAESLAALTDLVSGANKWIVGVNRRLQPVDQLQLFDPVEVMADWRLARGPAIS